MTPHEIECNRIAAKLNCEVDFYPADKDQESYEDDGALHVTRDGIDACFYVWDARPTLQNRLVRRLMAALNLPVTDRVLIRRSVESRVPRFGSAEWCETQADNLGDSPDY